MGTFRAFLLGLGTAYAVYYITKKRIDGTSLMDDLLADPARFMTKAKDYAIGEAIFAVKKKLI